ncbi:hypothetical protein ACFE04_010816 [Oxalis oulophora]
MGLGSSTATKQRKDNSIEENWLRPRNRSRLVKALTYGLVLDVDNVPMAVPFVHTRMQEMMPCRGANFPRIGKMGLQLPKTEFIDDEIEYEDDDMNEDEMVVNFYDPVCAISDNGGSLSTSRFLALHL